MKKSGTRGRGERLGRLRSTPRATYGMLLAHFGVAVFVTE